MFVDIIIIGSVSYNQEGLLLLLLLFCVCWIKMEAPMVQIHRTSSIEREPRTLSMQQMQSARDLAIFIFNTKTFDEASTIFTQVPCTTLFIILYIYSLPFVT